MVSWFRSYITDRSFIVNVENDISDLGNITCGVPQGSILGPLLFLLYVNDMPQAVKCEMLLYADDTCLIFSAKDLDVIQEQLNRDFNELCDWFVDNKLSIHFGEDKTKSILFTKRKKMEGLEICHGNIKIKQHSKVTYLGCILDEKLSGEPMAIKVIGKINGRLKFLYRKNKFLTTSLRRLLCNALIQPHFDFASSAWYPNLTQKISNKIQTTQNKCIRFCLQMGNREHVGSAEFEKINWLPVVDRHHQMVSSSVSKFFNKQSPSYMAEMYIPVDIDKGTRRSVLKLFQPSRRTSLGQRGLSYVGPSVWNKIPSDIKLIRNINTFKHTLKAWYFKRYKEKETSAFS